MARYRVTQTRFVRVEKLPPEEKPIGFFGWCVIVAVGVGLLAAFAGH